MHKSMLDIDWKIPLTCKLRAWQNGKRNSKQDAGYSLAEVSNKLHGWHVRIRHVQVQHVSGNLEPKRKKTHKRRLLDITSLWTQDCLGLRGWKKLETCKEKLKWFDDLRWPCTSLKNIENKAERLKCFSENLHCSPFVCASRPSPNLSLPLSLYMCI